MSRETLTLFLLACIAGNLTMIAVGVAKILACLRRSEDARQTREGPPP